MTPTKALLATIFLLAASIAAAADNSLLIQVEPGGGYRVWHTEGATNLGEEEILMLAAGATPEGSALQPVSAGPARAFQTGNGVIIEVPGAAADRKLLVDRDACGAVKVWHADGATRLTEEQLTELVITALPGGGKLVKVDGRYAKSFVTPLGYAVVIWAPVKR
ncbi:MAG: hypothetical protein HZA64_05085 [Rhodocyclales bacterium]|nr:hypothetical protein [Rhodocyclales bacterium]MBI5784815.1 hypothetical protein [Rhodocyclales bacterium]